MNIGDLRKAIEGLPDSVELIIEFGSAGQKGAVFTDVCTHENDGQHYSADAMETSIREGDGLDPECWDKLEKPTFKIVA